MLFGIFSLDRKTCNCKVKGIHLNYENSKDVNFTTLKDMILEDAPPMHVHNLRKINGNMVVWRFQSPRHKKYKDVFKKRRLTTILCRCHEIWEP